MLTLLEKYCGIASPSGSEEKMREAIIDDTKDFADDYKTDALGNLIVFKKGKQTPPKKVMLDAHLDEIGFMITDIDENGAPITRITIFEGAVTVQKKAEDGTLSEETRIESGKEAIIYQENDEEILEILDEIDETLLPKEVLIFLQEEAVRDNHEIIYSDEKIIELLEKLENSEEVENSEEIENTEEAVVPEKAVYTVTFMYDGKIFGTQSVVEGELVTEPTLKPSPTGKWNYDFTKPITEDTIIEFVD